MIIKQAEFMKSAAGLEGFISSSAPKIVFAGKSNVGKSSFINALVCNKKLARTSNTPGRTRLVNYFEINKGELNFVDLPGYGYAKGSKVEIETWGKLMETFFSFGQISHIIFLVDIRHNPTKDDLVFLNYLNYYRFPFTVVATKMDKISRSQVKPRVIEIARELKLGVDNIIPVSSEKRQGLENVLEVIDKAVQVANELNAQNGLASDVEAK